METVKKIVGSILISVFFLALPGRPARAEDRTLEPMKARVSNVASRLYAASGVKTYFTITDERGKTAFVLPNGSILITSGLVDACESDDEIAFILAHELSHVAAGDYKRMSRPTLAGGNEPDSQRRETNADINGVYYTSKAGYSPYASLKLLERIKPEGNTAFSGRLSTLKTYLLTLKK